MAKHKSFTVATMCKSSSVIRRAPAARHQRKHQRAAATAFPQKTDLSGYSQSDLDKVGLRLNQRPRKTLGFETPASKLQASVASIH
jgi:IS30 family transposase